MTEGTEVPNPLALRPPHHPGPGPLLRYGEGQPRVGLVVAVPDVEPGPVRLDQVVLEHEGVDLGGGDDPLDAPGLDQHGLGAGVLRPAPVGGHPLAQRDGLPDIDHPAVGVAKEVGAGRVRD